MAHDPASGNADAIAMANAMAAGADALAGVAHARSASNVEARTVKDADRSETSTASFSRRDSDIGTEEGWAQFLQEHARRDRVHFDNAQSDSRGQALQQAEDSRRHANESAERTAMMHTESIKYLSSLSAQVLDAQKLGTNNMWTASNELEFIAEAVSAKILAQMASAAA